MATKVQDGRIKFVEITDTIGRRHFINLAQIVEVRIDGMVANIFLSIPTLIVECESAGMGDLLDAIADVEFEG